MAVLTRIQETVDRLGLVEAAHQVLELMCLRLRLLMEAMAEGQLCITGRIMAAAEAGQQHLRVHTEVPAKAEEAELPRQRREETVVWVQPRHRHRSAWRIQVVVEVVVRTLWVDIREQRVVRAS